MKNEISLSKIISFTVKVVLPIIGAGLILFFAIFFTLKMLQDKKAKSVIDEGKYILSVLADEYETILLSNRSSLDKERRNLLSLRTAATNTAQKAEIEKKLRDIENQRRSLNTKVQASAKEKKQIEQSMKGLEESLQIARQNVLELKKENQELSVKKASSDAYWKNYVGSIKGSLNSIYKRNLAKLTDIRNGFAVDNGRNYVTKELSSFSSTIYNQSVKIKNADKIKEEEVKQVSKKLNDEIKRLSKNINDQEKEISSLVTTVEKADRAISFQKRYLKVINQFQRTAEYYNKAESLYKQRKYTQAVAEYERVIQEFENIKSSSARIDEIHLRSQNAIALSHYNRALGNIKNKKYDTAFADLSNVMKEAPMSDYTDKALSDLLKIGSSLSDRDKISIANKTASQLYNKGENSRKAKKYEEAIAYYNDIITNYPFSDYIRSAFEGMNNISESIKQKDFEEYDEEIRDKFTVQYDKYLEHYKKGDLENARKYYFLALDSAFNNYTNDSIDEFKVVEDEYIELLLKNTREMFMKRFSSQ